MIDEDIEKSPDAPKPGVIDPVKVPNLDDGGAPARVPVDIPVPPRPESAPHFLDAHRAERASRRSTQDHIDREANARLLESSVWRDINGEYRQIHWSAGRQALFETLLDASGRDSIPGKEVEMNAWASMIALFLASHDHEMWNSPRRLESGEAIHEFPPLRSDIPYFLDTVEHWGDLQFPIHDPMSDPRFREATGLLREYWKVIASFQVEPYNPDDESSDEYEEEGDDEKKQKARHG